MSKKEIPAETIKVFARGIFDESRRYGFSAIDVIRLINELMDIASGGDAAQVSQAAKGFSSLKDFHVDSLPLRSPRVQIRLARGSDDEAILGDWLSDDYGKHFLLSCASASATDLKSLLTGAANKIGIIEQEGRPIGAVAFLDIDKSQRRAELRKLIGAADARGRGLAEEATRLWIRYGGEQLGLEKIYVSTLQTHLRNIQLNESIGFHVEGLQRSEVRIDGKRFDVLRMGLLLKEFE